jgi:hypothetical protein
MPPRRNLVSRVHGIEQGEAKMRRIRWVAVAALVALLAASVAVASGRLGRGKTDSVTATFNTVRTEASERTCTGNDGTYRIAREVFEGTVTSTDPRLGGKIRLRLKSVVNQATGYGTTGGSATFYPASGEGFGDKLGHAKVIAVNSGRTVLNGVLVGRVKASGDRPAGALVANFTAGSTSATALAGELGSTTGLNSAVIQGGDVCRSDRQAKADERKAKAEARKQERKARKTRSQADEKKWQKPAEDSRKERRKKNRG